MFTIAEICRCTQGKLLQGDLSSSVRGVSTDTRTIRRGDLFVALQGKNFDGHKFISTAIAKKASAVLLSRRLRVPHISVPVILVPDTLQAYCALARFHRERFSIPVIALTGSVGKTTTKELIAQVLSRRFCLLKNILTENNEIGVAKTLLQLHKHHDLAILEFGTNHFGEIKRLTLMGQPTIALMMNIGDSHLEFLRSRRGVFKEKSDIARYSSKLTEVIYNADDVWLRKIEPLPKTAKRITFSVKQKSCYQGTDVQMCNATLSFSVKGVRFSMHTALRDNVYNALAAIILGKRFGISDSTIKRSLHQVQFPKGRQNILKIDNRWIIDDTYNANPTSVSAALKALKFFSVSGKKFFVFGDMRELGKESYRAHLDVGSLAARCGIDMMLTYGRWARVAAAQARKKKIPSCHCASQDDLVRCLIQQTLPGDVILVKGSRGMRMECVIEKLKTGHF